MSAIIQLCLGTIVRLFCSRRSLLLENLALRQQLAVFKRRHPRPRLDVFDKLFWVTARQIWRQWKNSLTVVTPETVVGWHRAGFRLYWKLISRVRKAAGRKRLPKDIRDLVFRMVAEVKFDHFTGGRFRHGTKFLRWRPEKNPKDCTMEQVRRESDSALNLL